MRYVTGRQALEVTGDKVPALCSAGNPLKALFGQWTPRTCSKVPAVVGRDPLPYLFASIPPRTFMALKSLSAKYSGVLRIHFTEEREEEAVSYSGCLRRGIQWLDLLLSFHSSGVTQFKPRKNLGC